MTKRCEWCDAEFETDNPRRIKCDGCRSHVAYPEGMAHSQRRLTQTTRDPGMRYRLSHGSRQ